MKKIAAIRMICHENTLFFYLLATILVMGFFPLVLLDKVLLFRWLKQWHYPMLDCMFPYFTWLGDGVTYLCLLLIVALFHASCRKIMIMGGSFVFMSMVVQLLKRVFFAHRLRPMGLMALDDSIHLIDGVPLPVDFSFPSGHAATIFTLISLVQLLSRNKKKIYSISLLVLALLVAYSRIYLCQHFYTDLYVGAWIGVSTSLVVYLCVIEANGPDWLDRSIYFFLSTNGKRIPVKK